MASVRATRARKISEEEKIMIYENEIVDGLLIDNLEKGNLVDQLEDNQQTSQDTLELFNKANQSMNNWRKKYKKAINLAKLQAMSGDTEISEKSFPFEGASLAMLPFVTEAMLDFNSRAAPELVWSKNIVAAKIYGKISTPQVQPMMQTEQQNQLVEMQKAAEQQDRDNKEARADRISEYMNYQLSEEMENWRDEQDKNLMVLPCVGTAYKKTYFDYDKKKVCSDLYLADQVIFDMEHDNFYDAPDKFIKRKYSRNEVIGFIRGEQEWQLEESKLEDKKDCFDFLEAYTWIDLDDDGLKEPYIQIIFEDTNETVALFPYYDEDTISLSDGEIISIKDSDCWTQYRYLPDIEGGPMGTGWGILFGPMFESINANLRQLIDAGTLSNTASNTGLIANDTVGGMGNSAQAGPIEVVMGQLNPIPVRGNLRDGVLQMPFAGPSQTLFQLMEYLINSARSMTNASVNVESSPGEAAALYLARLKQGLKIPNSITMRVYSAAKREKQRIALLNHKHFDSEKYNKVLDDSQEFSMQADFNPKDCDIRMAADPAQGSDIERVQRAEAVLQQAKEQPQQILNLRTAYVDWLEAMDVPNIEELAPEPDPSAVDPQQQLMAAQMQMEAELKKKDQELRQNAQRLQEQKLAMQAAKEMSELGLAADEQEAKITKMYAETLKTLVDAGIAGYEQAIEAAQDIEERFIDNAEGGTINERQVQASNPITSGPMVSPPSNQSIPDMS